MENKKLILTGQLCWHSDDLEIIIDDESLVELIDQHFELAPNQHGFYWLTDPQHIARITIELVDDLDMEHGREYTQH